MAISFTCICITVKFW